MSEEQISDTLRWLETSLGDAYPVVVQAPDPNAQSRPVSNFSRCGPFRKVRIVAAEYGDMEYGEVTQDEYYRILGAQQTLETELREALTRKLGEPLAGTPEDLDDYDVFDTSREGEELDGVEWMPSAERGAFPAEVLGIPSFWRTSGNDYVALMRGEWTGDGDFEAFVAVSITPPSASGGQK